MYNTIRYMFFLFLSISILSFTLLLYLGSTVINFPRKNEQIYSLSLFFFITALIALTEVLVRTAPDKETAFYYSLLSIPWPIAQAAYLHFIISFVSRGNYRKIIVIPINYALALGFSGLYASYLVNTKPISYVYGFVISSPVLTSLPYFFISLWTTSLHVFLFAIMIYFFVKGPREGLARKQGQFIMAAVVSTFFTSYVVIISLNLFFPGLPELTGLSYVFFGLILYVGIRRGTLFYLESRYLEETLFEEKNELIVVTDYTDRVIKTNRPFRKTFGENEKTLLYQIFSEYLAQYTDLTLKKLKALGTTFENQEVCVAKAGGPVNLLLSRKKIQQRKISGYLYTAVDITRIRMAEHEKEIMLSEIFHRVKNNMQLTLSLFDLKSTEIQDTQFNSTLTEFKNIIYVLAETQDRLYKEKNLAEINMSDMIQTVAEEIKDQLIPVIGVKIYFTYSLQPLFLPYENALLFSLIVTELLTLVLHFHRQTETAGNVAVELINMDDSILIRCSGKIAGGADNDTARGYFSTPKIFLIYLINQLNGTISSNTEEEYKVTISTPAASLLAQ